MELTYKELELLQYLAQYAGQEVGGYEFVGAIRTVDIHIRRLRAKLGTEHEQMIGIVPQRRLQVCATKHGNLGMAVAPGETDDGSPLCDASTWEPRV
jgi:hypothetical protein